MVNIDMVKSILEECKVIDYVDYVRVVGYINGLDDVESY